MVKKKSAGLSAMFVRIGILFLLNFFLLLMPPSLVNVYAYTIIDTVPVGNYPVAVAVNPITKKVYVANWNGNVAPGTVTVIDANDNYSTTTVNVGPGPRSIAVNTVTNKIYVVGEPSPSVTVIDGDTNAPTTIADVWDAINVAVNSVTNKVYVTTWSSNIVTVINGAINSTPASILTTVPVGTDIPYVWDNPDYVAVNPVTNKIYVANWSSNPGTVTVIDANDNYSTATVPVGINPRGIAVNPVTNKIYVANCGSSTVTVINGATDSIATTLSPVPYNANAMTSVIAVNTVTNKIYVGGPGTVTVINGATNFTPASISATVPVSSKAIAVDSVHNKIYVTTGGTVTVIDADDNNSTTPVPLIAYGGGGSAIDVDSVHNMVYVAELGISNQSPGTVSVISGSSGQYVPAGTDVSVSVPVSAPAGDLTVTFDEVTSPGVLSVVETTCVGGFNFRFLGKCYEITFTGGAYQGDIQITFPYGDIDPTGLAMLHCPTGNQSCGIIYNTSINTQAHTITFTVSSLSTFGIGWPYYAGYSTGANTNMIAILALLAISGGLFILRKNKWIKA